MGGGDGGGGVDGGEGGWNCASKDSAPWLPLAKEKLCPKPGATHSFPNQPSKRELVISRVHVAPSATANGSLEAYGAPNGAAALSVVPSEQLRLQPTAKSPAPLDDPLEQVIAEKIDGGGGENGGDGGGDGGCGGGGGEGSGEGGGGEGDGGGGDGDGGGSDGDGGGGDGGGGDGVGGGGLGVGGGDDGGGDGGGGESGGEGGDGEGLGGGEVNGSGGEGDGGGGEGGGIGGGEGHGGDGLGVGGGGDGDGGGGEGGGGDGDWNCTSKDSLPRKPSAKEKLCPKPGADHSLPSQPQPPFRLVISRVHVAPSATDKEPLSADGSLEAYGAPPLSVVPSEQLRLQPIHESPTPLDDPLEQVIAEEIDGGGGGGDGGGGESGGAGGGGDGDWNCTSKDSLPRKPSAKEKLCPKPGADHSLPSQPQPPFRLVISRVHVAPSATDKEPLSADGSLEAYGAPPLSVVPSEQLRLQPIHESPTPL